VVAPIGDIDVAGGINRHSGRAAQFSKNGGPAIAGRAYRPVAGHRGDGVVGSKDFADAAAVFVRDIDVAFAVDGNPCRSMQTGKSCGLAIATKRGAAVSGVSADLAAGVHLAHAGVGIVCDVEVAGAIERDARWLVQTSAGGGSAIAAERVFAVPGNGGDDVRGKTYLADPVVAGVSNVEVSGLVYGDAEGSEDFSAGGKATVTGISAGASARYGGDVSDALCESGEAQQKYGRANELETCPHNFLHALSIWELQQVTRRAP
jgi:hypothetical protein